MGLGFFKSFSKGDDVVDNLSRKGLLPGFHLRYSFEQSEGLRFGVELATASYNFEGDTFESYDNVIVEGTVEENVFSLGAYAQYELSVGKLRPYFLGGLSFNSSSVETQLATTYLDDAFDRTSLLVAGTRSSQLGILIRGGASYELSEQLNVYLDLGTGVSVMQVGAVFNLGGSKTSIEE